MSSAKTSLAQSRHRAPLSKEVDIVPPKDIRRRPHFARLKSTLPLNHFSHASPSISEPGSQANKLPPYFSAHPPSHARTPHTTQFRYSEFERDHGNSDLDSLPAGFPYKNWYGLWCFASEYLRRMQILVSECMEGNGRYGGIRHTT